jgi:hypothetical protein
MSHDHLYGLDDCQTTDDYNYRIRSDDTGLDNWTLQYRHDRGIIFKIYTDRIWPNGWDVNEFPTTMHQVTEDRGWKTIGSNTYNTRQVQIWTMTIFIPSLDPIFS